MSVKIRCLSCNESYTCFYGNTQVHTSIIETECPVCGHKEFRNMSKFLDLQTSHYEENYSKIADMISMARLIGKLVNNERGFRKNQR